MLLVADVSCVGKARVVYKDLRGCVGDTGKLPDGSPCKADSAMWESYNTFTNGHGGCCATWEGDDSPYGPMGNYYCGNSSAGGWVGYNDPRDKNHTQGQSPILPVSFEYNSTKAPELARFGTTGGRGVSGAVMHVWRAQGWYVNMFELAKNDPSSSTMTFASQNGHVKGGWQGGRGWHKNSPNISDASKPKYLAADKVRQADFVIM